MIQVPLFTIMCKPRPGANRANQRGYSRRQIQEAEAEVIERTEKIEHFSRFPYQF